MTVAPDVLRQFLGNALSAPERLRDLPRPACGDLSDWIVYLERHLGVIAVPVTAGTDRLRGYPLWIGQYGEYGPVLLEYVPALLRGDTVRGLALESGERFDLPDAEQFGLTDLRVLFEPFVLDRPITIRRVADFVLRPARGLMREALLCQALIALTASLLFIANFSILAYVVPTQNLGAFWAIAWLMAGAAATIGLGHFLAQRVQFHLDSLIEERAEILKLSLLWSMRPQYIAVRGIHRAHEQCAVVSRVGKATSDAVIAVVASLAIAPILILLYLRLPTFLFFATLVIAVVGTVPQVFFQWRQGRRQRRLVFEETESDGYLYRIMGNITRLNFYDAAGRAIAHWQQCQREIADARRSVAAGESRAREAEATLMDVTQLLAIFALTVLVAFAAQTGNALTVGLAFIMLYLVTQTYRMIPRVATAIGKVGAIRIDLLEAKDLLEEAAQVHALNTPTVTQANASVECHRLRLPHGCRFKDAESLTLRIEGPRVVRIAGESGAGKTTFLNCLLGLQAPDSGAIEVLGVDPTRLSMNERRRIFAYADQNVQLLPGTVRDNLLLFGATTSGDRSLWESLELVGLVDRVRALPLGLNTPIGDARRDFSTGERQRMALAQCVIKRSAILVLDEAMSGLPMDMEEVIFTSIRPLFEQIYFVSHRSHMHAFAETVIELETRR